MSGALKNAAGSRSQWKNVAGLDQIFRHSGRLGHDLNRARTVSSRNAGGDSARGIHAHLKIRAKTFAVLFDHSFDAQLLQSFGTGRNANESASVLGHEVDRGGRDELRG